MECSDFTLVMENKDLCSQLKVKSQVLKACYCFGCSTHSDNNSQILPACGDVEKVNNVNAPGGGWKQCDTF